MCLVDNKPELTKQVEEFAAGIEVCLVNQKPNVGVGKVHLYPKPLQGIASVQGGQRFLSCAQPLSEWAETSVPWVFLPSPQGTKDLAGCALPSRPEFEVTVAKVGKI